MSIPERQRFLALALLVALLGGLYTLLIVPYLSLIDDYHRQERQLESKLAVYEQVRKDGAVAERQLKELTRFEASRHYYLPSDKPALSSAALQRHVKEAIERSGGTVVSSQVLRETTDDELPQVVLRISMRLGPDALGKVLHSLEYDRPLLFIDNLYIASRPSVRSRQQRGDQTAQLLDVRFEVTGYRRQMNDA